MTKDTAKLLEDYKREYLRVNNREITVDSHGAWVELNKTFYRKFEALKMLEILKQRRGYFERAATNGRNAAAQALQQKIIV